MMVQKTGFSFFQLQPDPRVQVVTQDHDLQKIENCLLQSQQFAFDYETSGLRWWKGARSVGVAFAAQGPNDPHPLAWYVPYRHITGQKQIDPDKALLLQKTVLETDHIQKIAHNIIFDAHMASADGIEVRGPRHDTMIQARLYDENRAAGLKDRALFDLNDGDAHLHNELVNTEIARLAKSHGMRIKEYKDAVGFSEIDVYTCGTYGGHDAVMTLNLHRFYGDRGVRDYFKRIYPTEMDLTRVIGEMEEIGVPLDIPYLQNLAAFLEAEKAKAEQFFWAQEPTGCQKFNLASDDSLLHYIQFGLKVKLEKKTKNDNYSVDSDVIAGLSQQFPHMLHLLRWKEVEKKLSTYTYSLIELCDEHGVLHGSFKQMGTNTGRLSCMEPNLQNIPSDDPQRAKEHGGLDPESVKRAFIVQRSDSDSWFGKIKTSMGFAPRMYRLCVDYSQIELRVLAHYTQDPRLVRTYLEDGDIHEEVENAVFGTGKNTAEGDVNRRKAKVINFGLSYCMTPIGYARQIGCSSEEAEAAFNEYHLKFPGVQEFRTKFWNYIRANNCQFHNCFGRVRRVPLIASVQKWEKSRAERQAIATLIQGTAAELTKESLVRIWNWLRAEGLQSRPVQTVHDEVQIDGPAQELAHVSRQVQALMTDYPEFDPIPIKVGSEVVLEHWAKKIEISLDRAA